MINYKLKMWAFLLIMLIAMPVMANDFNSKFAEESN